MKKLLFIFIFALIGCSADEVAVEQPCACKFDAIRYISFDEGQTWSFNSYDGRHGMVLECELERELLDYRDGFMYKLVFKCRE